MIGKIVSTYEHSYISTNGAINAESIENVLSLGIPQYTATEIATTLCLVVGIIHVN